MTTTASKPAADEASRSWTVGVRRWLLRDFPPEKALPDTQPEYVSSWIYVFGVATLAALVVVVGVGHWSSSLRVRSGTTAGRWVTS